MYKMILCFIGLFSCCNVSFAQDANKRVLFVIDSIPLINDPEDWNPITSEDINDIVVIANKDSLKQLGWGRFNAVTYVFTKAYRNRADSLKRIPSLKQMVEKKGVWFLNDTPYSGRYIDYYNSGRIQNKGSLDNGKLNGELTVYFKSGAVKSVSNYKNGVLHGSMKQYYKNGLLMQETGYTEGKTNGVYESRYINGQIGNDKRKKNGTAYDTVITYYSTGKIRGIRLIKNGNPIRGKNENDISYYATYFQQSLNKGDIKEMRKNFFKLWLLDSTNIDTQLKEGMLLAKEYYFDKALAAFDRVLEIEPLERNALLQRGITRLKKHIFLQSGSSFKNEKDIALTLEGLLSMTEDEQTKVCKDLQLADDLDHTDYIVKKAVPETIWNYCKGKKLKY